MASLARMGSALASPIRSASEVVRIDGLFMRRAFSQNSASHLLPCERNPSTHHRQSEKAMLSPKTQYNLANAKSYFEEHLCVGDYYSETQRVQGEWLGNGAAML